MQGPDQQGDEGLHFVGFSRRLPTMPVSVIKQRCLVNLTCEWELLARVRFPWRRYAERVMSTEDLGTGTPYCDHTLL